MTWAWLRVVHLVLMVPGMAIGFAFQFAAESFEVGRQLWKRLP